ncbi:hypothetical protein AHAS_Ahas20G0255400 [Arachis hypogaea]
MKVGNLKPTHEALNSLIRAYGDSGMVDAALRLFYTVRKVHGCFPSVVASNSLLNCLVKRDNIEVARKLYDEMLMIDGGTGKVEEG